MALSYLRATLPLSVSAAPQLLRALHATWPAPVPDGSTAAHHLQPASGRFAPSARTFASASAAEAALAPEPPPAPEPVRPPSPPPKLNFDDYRAIFKTRTTGELVRAYIVLSACNIGPLVSNAETLIKASRRLLGDRITFGVIRHTFFEHFCAGEDEASMQPTIQALRDNGIRAIIDYAAEDDIDAAAPAPPAAPPPTPTAQRTARDGAVGRVYDYASELACDRHVATFLSAIATAGRLPGPGIAAIKVTALGNPMLLERLSSALLQIRALFAAADSDGDGYVDRAEFGALYRALYAHAPEAKIEESFQGLDLERAGRVDIITWTLRIRLQDIPAMVERVKRHGSTGWLPDSMVARGLTDEEVQLADAMLGRLARLAQAAAEASVKLMVDAEHTYFQPAIDHAAKALSAEYNTGREPIIFNTYQAYLVDTRKRLLEDMERARREGYLFGAKLVRGAYLSLERRRAAELGYPSPVWGALEETHACYDACLDALLDDAAAHGTQLMVASHNQASVQRAVDGMAARGLAPAGGGVFFGQLLGMSDNLTYTLGQAGYQAFKYVPYGKVAEVMPYLVRRAQENSAIMGAGVAQQRGMLWRELTRRLLPFGGGR